jgi:hypothetical protein
MPMPMPNLTVPRMCHLAGGFDTASVAVAAACLRGPSSAASAAAAPGGGDWG